MDKARRYTAIDVLSHPWIVCGGNTSQQLPGVSNISTYCKEIKRDLQEQAKHNYESYQKLKEKKRREEWYENKPSTVRTAVWSSEEWYKNKPSTEQLSEAQRGNEERNDMRTSRAQLEQLSEAQRGNEERNDVRTSRAQWRQTSGTQNKEKWWEEWCKNMPKNSPRVETTGRMMQEQASDKWSK